MSSPTLWSPRDLRLRQWVLTHPGACKSIAEHCAVSSEYVRLVLYGKRGGDKGKVTSPKATSPKMRMIVRALKLKGAPL